MKKNSKKEEKNINAKKEGEVVKDNKTEKKGTLKISAKVEEE